MSLTLIGQANAPAAPSAGKFKFYIDDSGNAYVVDENRTAVAVAPTGVNGVGGANGQVWTADGANGATWQNAKASLSDYQNLIVIDEAGNGDYIYIDDAVQAEGAGKTYLLIGTVSPTIAGLTPPINSTFIIPAGSILDLNSSPMNIAVTNVRIAGRGRIVGSGGSVISLNSGSLFIYGPTITGEAFTNGIEINGGSFEFYQIRTQSSLGAGIRCTSLPSAGFCIGSYISSMISTPTWSNAPFYHCVFSAALDSTITVDSGTPVGSNVIVTGK